MWAVIGIECLDTAPHQPTAWFHLEADNADHIYLDTEQVRLAWRIDLLQSQISKISHRPVWQHASKDKVVNEGRSNLSLILQHTTLGSKPSI